MIMGTTSVDLHPHIMSHIKLWEELVRYINSLAPGRSDCDSKNVIFNIVLLIGIFKSAYDNVLR